MPGIPFPEINPVAIQIGPLAIRWYALAYITGILLGWWYMRCLSKRWTSPIGAELVDDFVVWATVGIVVGGRLGYALFYNLDQYLADPIQVLVVWRGGMSFHGGLLGVMTAAWLFARRRRISLLALTDLLACAAPIGLFFGRVANFINGELSGRLTDVPWAMVFPDGGPLPRHPSQLYEALLEGLVLLSILAFLAYRPAIYSRAGLLTGLFLIGYGVARFLVEFVREPDAQLGFVLGFYSMGQILSAPLVFLGVYLAVRAWAATVSHGPAKQGSAE